jgi:hypothetical protein
MFCLEVRGDGGEMVGTGCRGEKWPKQCMHMSINEKKKKPSILTIFELFLNFPHFITFI